MPTTEPILEYVLRHLSAAKGQRQIADATGIPYSTLTKIIQGRIKNPGIQHIQALYDYFHQTHGQPPETDQQPPDTAAGIPNVDAAHIYKTALAPTLGEPRLGSDRRDDERRKPDPRAADRREDERRQEAA